MSVTIRISVELPPKAIDLLDRMAAYGIWGDKIEDIACYLIFKGLEEQLKRGGLLHDQS